MGRPLNELFGLAMESEAPDVKLRTEVANRFHEFRADQQRMLMRNERWENRLRALERQMSAESRADFYSCLGSFEREEEGQLG